MKGFLATVLQNVRIGIAHGIMLATTSRRCTQCYRPHALTAFVGARGNQVTWCLECRDLYRNWDSKTLMERAAARRPVTRTGTGYTVSLTRRSANRKTGPIPVSTTDMRSCPPSCPQIDAGCYAGYGKAAWHWRNVADRGDRWDIFCAKVARLPAGTLWRHNEAGDLPGLGEALDVRALDMLVRANRGRRGFSFTHKKLRTAGARHAVKRANALGFRINLSADNLREADAFAELGIGPVVVILPSGSSKATRTPAGRKVVVCPAATHAITCQRCQLCQKARAAIIGFPAHGQGSRLVTLRAKSLSP